METKAQQLADRILDFVVRVIKIVDALPNTVTARHVGGQLTNAATSCGANYEEGCGAESRPDFIHKMSIVLKELKETRFWLRLIHRTELIPLADCAPTIDECEQLCAIVARSIITAKNKKNSR
jgi:four helix bundle protein